MIRSRTHVIIALGSTAALTVSALAVGLGPMATAVSTPRSADVATAPLAAVGEAPIVNPGFEEPLDADGSIPGWNRVGSTFPGQSVGVVDDVAHTGSRSLRVEDPDKARALSIETDPFPVDGGVVYEASAMMSVERDQLGLFVRFYDAAGNRVTNERVLQGSTAGEWEQVTFALSSPADAVTATLLINSASTSDGLGHVDDVTMVATDEEPQPRDVQEILDGDARISYLGSPVKSQITGVPSVGVEDGRAVGYQMFKGIGSTEQPGTFVVFDLETGETLRTFPIDDVDNNWGATVAADGRVYFATYHDYGLHRYDPATKTVENLGVINPPAPKEGYPWTMAPGPGNTVFIGTYPKGDLWQYHPDTETFENWGHDAWGPSDPDQSQYLRGMAYHPGSNDLFVSTGSTDPAVWRLDVDTREAVRITNETKQPGISTESFISAMTVVGDHVFARGYKSKNLLVMDLDGNTEYWGNAGGTLYVLGRTFVAHPTDPDKVLFTNRSELWSYGLSDRSVAATGADIGSYVSDAVVDPGDSTRLLGLSGSGTFALDLDDPADPALHPFSFAQPSVLETVLPGPDNTMWAAGYMSSIARVDTTGAGIEYPTLQVSRQFESSIVRDGLMYLGAYTGSSFQEFDPSTPMAAPRTLFTGTSQGFDRPITMTYDSQNDKAYMGSIPGYGLNQGGISVWDFTTETVEHFTTEVVVDQGVSSAVFNPGDGMVYLGTNVDGGNGHPDTGLTEAYLITWDPTTDTKLAEMIPVPDRRGITGLTVGPDGRIWGVAEDIVFIYNPAIGEVEHRLTVLGSGYGSGNHWSWGYLAYSDKDDMMYASLGSRLLRIDPETLEVSNVGIGKGSRLHADDEGNLYFLAYYGSHHLFRYTPDDTSTPPADDVRPTVSLASPTTGGPFQELAIQVDAADEGGLDKIVANVYRDGSLVRSTQSAAGGATSASHTATVPLPDGEYTVRYNAHDLAGNVSKTGTFAVTIDGTAPTATVKDGASYTVRTGETYDLISFKLHDAGKIDKVVLNGAVKDLVDNAWSDVNFIAPPRFGAVEGENTLVVHDVAGNTTTVEFTLN